MANLWHAGLGWHAEPLPNSPAAAYAPQLGIGPLVCMHAIPETQLVFEALLCTCAHLRMLAGVPVQMAFTSVHCAHKWLVHAWMVHLCAKCTACAKAMRINLCTGRKQQQQPTTLMKHNLPLSFPLAFLNFSLLVKVLDKRAVFPINLYCSNVQRRLEWIILKRVCAKRI